MSVRILTGDCMTVLRTLPAESVQVCVCSPPYYALRDYGVDGQIGLEQAPAEFIAKLVAVFEEVKRVLHPTGTLWCNIGDSYSGSGKGPTGHNGLQNAETRQGFSSGYLRENGEWSTGGRKSKTEGTAGIPAKNLLLIPERFAIAMQDAGWIVRSRIAWCKTCAMPESVRDRPTSAWEHVWMFSRARTYFYDVEAVRQPLADKTLTHRGGGTNGKADHQDALGKVASGNWGTTVPVRTPNEAGANLRNWWALGPEPSKLNHYAAFPTEIPRRCILAGTSEKGACPACGAPWRRVVERTGEVNARDRLKDAERDAATNPTCPSGITSLSGATYKPQRRGTDQWQPGCSCPPADPVPCVVLDPFLGSGTTCLVAERLGRDSIGVELNPQYAEMSRQRIYGDAPMFNEVTVEGETRTVTPVEPATSKQDGVGKRTYTGFNARWKASHEATA